MCCGLGLAISMIGCSSGATVYRPQVVAQHELVLRYDDGLEMWAAGRPVAKSYRYEGLAEFVRCVPEAHRNALEAQSDGGLARSLTVSGGVLAGVGLGGLGGLA